ncbi:unnamed protein product [Kuraishia capsulata CBS 1993]|uniref:Uncharacterized protein n=1 Tax=Kuraishia capsulata CBS 1993 TaxID=1382522 RepID=W6MF24_9ASCO|nr:unnamed protein product [Kuraishia capsulata CBS 1993]
MSDSISTDFDFPHCTGLSSQVRSR